MREVILTNEEVRSLSIATNIIDQLSQIEGTTFDVKISTGTVYPGVSGMSGAEKKDSGWPIIKTIKVDAKKLNEIFWSLNGILD